MSTATEFSDTEVYQASKQFERSALRSVDAKVHQPSLGSYGSAGSPQSTVHSQEKMAAVIDRPLQPTPLQAPEMSVFENAALAECESKIREGLKSFFEMGRALARIRDGKLYRDRFRTFEAYCLEMWEITDRRARQLCAAAEVLDHLTAYRFGLLPETESQARPLTQLPVEERAPAWKDVLSTMPEGGVTAAHVALVVQDRLARLNGTTVTETSILTKAGQVQSPKANVQSQEKTAAVVDRPLQQAIDLPDLSSRHKHILAVTRETLLRLRELEDLIGAADSRTTGKVRDSIRNIDEIECHVAAQQQTHASAPERKVFG